LSSSARRWLILFVTSGVFILSSYGEPPVNWRNYHAFEGLPNSLTTGVTVGADGTLIVKHGGDNLLSLFDGYASSQMPSPDQPLLMVHSGSNGKLWALYRDGFMQFEDGRWIPQPITEIENVMRSAMPGQRPLRWCSVQPNQILFLIGDHLLLYDATQGSTTVILRETQTKLGRFLDLGADGEGAIWLTGTSGLLRLGPTFVPEKVDTSGKAFDPPASIAIKNLRRPMNDEANGVTMLADSSINGDRLWARLADGAWQTGKLPDPLVDRVWCTPDGTIWFLSPYALYHRLPNGHSTRDATLAAQYWDVAVDRQGIFYLATSEGVFRYTPLPWRVPRGLEMEATPMQYIREDSQNRLWCAGDYRVMVQEHGSWKMHDIPGMDVASLQLSKGLVLLPDGHVLYGMNDRLYGFTEERDRFEEISHPSGAPLKLLGQLKDGTAVVQVLSRASDKQDFILESYDGKKFQSLNCTGLEGGALGTLNFIYATKEGDLWIGGAYGLAQFHQQKWKIFPQADGALSVIELGRGKIWFGGRNQIHQFDGQRLKLIQSGFDDVKAMTQSRDGSIWVATGMGLYRYYKNSWIFSGEREGLPISNTYDVFEDRDGALWAATSHGISLYHPDADVDPPRTTLTRDKPDTNSPLNHVSFSVRGLDRWTLTQNPRLLFAYQLDDGAWTTYAKLTRIEFQELNPGQHQLQVRAMDVNGNEEVKPVTLGFAILAPWYREPRLVGISAGALVLILILTGLAINRHRELVRSYARVEVIVQQRTRELEQANHELLHSQKMTALGTLAAGIAHDFNSILSVIKGSVQIIEKNLAEPEKVLSRTGRMATVIHQAESLVQAMLGYSRDEDLTAAECDINAAVEESLQLLDESFLRNINAELALDEATPIVRGSPELVARILSNLIINAADAMNGQGTIKLRTGQLSSAPPGLVRSPVPASAYAFIAVEDHGCGIQPEILPRIFEPFFTSKALSARHGTGLGLYMVFEFSKNLGAGLQVESTPGRGSIFTLIIPLAEKSKSDGANSDLAGMI
jgi:signal transduction histidine kinase